MPTPAESFLVNETQFQLGFLPTEQSNPLTKDLDKRFAADTADGIACLQRVDRDVLAMARRVFASPQYARLADTIEGTLRAGRRVCFSGCGATGRLSILLESMWRKACAETPALGPHLGMQVGEHWKCVPARLRAPVDGRDFVADLLVKPAGGKDLPADVDPASITLSPVWDHVSIEPLGPPTWRGIPLRLTVGAEMVSSWEFPKTFYLTIPDHGVASVYFEKIIPPTNAANQPGEKK